MSVLLLTSWCAATCQNSCKLSITAVSTSTAYIHLFPSFHRLSAGLTEEDFIGDSVREPLCTCLGKVAAALAALPSSDNALVQGEAEFKAAIESLKVSGCACALSTIVHVLHRR